MSFILSIPPPHSLAPHPQDRGSQQAKYMKIIRLAALWIASSYLNVPTPAVAAPENICLENPRPAMIKPFALKPGILKPGTPKTVTLHSITVTGSRASPLKQPHTFLSADSAQHLQEQGVMNSLQSVPGVTVQTNGIPGSLGGIQIRGNRAHHTLMTIDGIPLLDPSAPAGGTDSGSWMSPWEMHTTVFRGPQSLHYGSGSLGGVVALKTPHHDARDLAAISVEGGQPHHFQTRLEGTASGKDTHLLMGLTTHGSGAGTFQHPRHGNRLPDKNRHLSTGMHLVQGQFKTILIHQTSDSDTPNAEGILPLARNDKSEIRRALVSIQHGDEMNDHLIQGIFQQTARRHLMDTETDYKARGTVMQFKGAKKIHLARHTCLTVGSDVTAETVNAAGKSIQHAGGIYGRFLMPLSSRLALETGLRFDRFSHAKNALNHQTGLRYTKGAHSVFSTLGTGFRPPTIAEKKGYAPFIRPNKTLSPERSRSVEMGYRWDRKTAHVQIMGFAQHVTNLIQLTEERYGNTGKRRLHGLELDGKSTLGKDLVLRGNYTLTLGKDSGNRGKHPDRLPKHKVACTLEKNWAEKSALFLTGSLETARRDRARLEGKAFQTKPVRLRAVMHVRAGAHYIPHTGHKIYCRIENLLNQTAETIYGYTNRPRAFIIGYRRNFAHRQENHGQNTGQSI